MCPRHGRKPQLPSCRFHQAERIKPTHPPQKRWSLNLRCKWSVRNRVTPMHLPVFLVTPSLRFQPTPSHRGRFSFRVTTTTTASWMQQKTHWHHASCPGSGSTNGENYSDNCTHPATTFAVPLPTRLIGSCSCVLLWGFPKVRCTQNSAKKAFWIK